MILERLARRCGFEALEPHIPDAHRKLLTHIRKQTTRKERRRSEAGSQVGWGRGGLVGLQTRTVLPPLAPWRHMVVKCVPCAHAAGWPAHLTGWQM